MRKSTTSARMMKKRSRGIPKPLFQSVQFPALITTSNTLYQVGRDSTCFSCTLCLVLRSFVSLSRSLCGHKSRSCLYQVHGFSFYLHTFLFSVSLKFSLSLWSPSRLSASWPTQTLNPHTDVITAKHHFIRAVCEIHGKLVSPQVKHMHRNVPQQKPFVSRLFQWVEYISQEYDKEGNMLMLSFDEGSVSFHVSNSVTSCWVWADKLSYRLSKLFSFSHFRYPLWCVNKNMSVSFHVLRSSRQYFFFCSDVNWSLN